MAYCKIHAITHSMSKALEYIENPEKTDGQLLVTGYGVEPYTASLEMEITKQMALDAIGDRSVPGKANNLCYHLIQSFSPNDHITPEQAHEIGQRLADELLGGRFEYVVSTHIDKAHIHNHIIFNSTSFCDYKKFRSVPYQTIRKVNAISDRLCAEHNLSLSTLHKQQAVGFRFRPQQWSRYESWSAEIRKRLRFILETAEDYEQFKEAAAALGITINDSGQHITYIMDGQQRNTRDTALDKGNAFTMEGLQERIEAGCERRERLKKAIRAAADGVTEYRTFCENLHAMEVRTKRTKTAGVVYELPDGERIREWALGPGYSTQHIQDILAGRGEWCDDPVAAEDICGIYAAFGRPAAAQVAIQVSQKHIAGITPSGILVDVAGTGKIFIDRKAIDMQPGADTATVYLNPSAEYYAAKDEGSRPIRGEELIHKLELSEDVQPVELEIGSELIRGMSPAGVTISLPERGIDRLFIEDAFAEYDRTGHCRVKLYPNWSYAFTDTDGQRRYISGSNLAEHLSAGQRIAAASLVGRINALQRRRNISAAKDLAQLLSLLREEGIQEQGDFALRLSQIDEQTALLRESIQRLDSKNAQYKAVAKCLRIVQRTSPVNREYEQQFPKAKKNFLATHKEELSAYSSAISQLERAGVLPEVDPAKVEDLISRQAEEIKRLERNIKALSERAEGLRDAQERIRDIQTPPEQRKPADGRNEPQGR